MPTFVRRSKPAGGNPRPWHILDHTGETRCAGKKERMHAFASQRGVEQTDSPPEDGFCEACVIATRTDRQRANLYQLRRRRRIVDEICAPPTRHRLLR